MMLKNILCCSPRLIIFFERFEDTQSGLMSPPNKIFFRDVQNQTKSNIKLKTDQKIKNYLKIDDH